MGIIENDNSHETEQQRYKRAKKRAKGIRGFYYHRLGYCIMIPIVIAINLIYTPDYLWFFFPIIGAGIGLGFHAMEAFNYNPFLGKDWEQKKIKELMEREQQKRKTY